MRKLILPDPLPLRKFRTLDEIKEIRSPMTTTDLVDLAKRYNPHPPAKRNTDRWIPIVEILRSKGMTYLAIWEWLRDQGEPVHEDAATFISAVSKRYRRHLENLSGGQRSRPQK